MLQGPIEYWTHWNIEPFYFTWNLVFNSHVFLTVCNYYRYAVECSEICGYCLNKTNCHHINGLCLKGCDPSFQRDKCLGGTFFIVMNRVMAITWPYFVLRVQRIDDKKTKVLKMCVHLTWLYLWKKMRHKDYWQKFSFPLMNATLQEFERGWQRSKWHTYIQVLYRSVPMCL